MYNPNHQVTMAMAEAMAEMKYKIKHGNPYPSGSTPDGQGVNFSIFSHHAEQVELLLFDSSDSPDPFQVIKLKKEIHRTFFSWHVYVCKLPVGTWYTWRMDGPNRLREVGYRFDKDKHLLDPWAQAISHKNWSRKDACLPGENKLTAMRAVVADEHYDWEGDTPLRIRSEKAVLYEMHVGGFTRHPSAEVSHPGTFAAVIQKIPYLQQLGITHVELLPVMAFDEQDVPYHTAALGLKNYWGYSTHSFYSPHPGYCITPELGTHIKEFRDLVKALHKAGIGVILDVVFNHTAEAGANGPMINFRGLGGNIFYHLNSFDKSIYRDYTGCGNTVNANHPLVAGFIIKCLEYWVREMHVDGFRFDLASALARGENGDVLPNPPVLWGIELSEQLSKTKLIAEAWDAAGLYQVGSFPGYRWAEWNGLYRDVVRRFLRGDKNIIQELATRITGSSDLYQYKGGLPISSINFITCHDGFTLYDLFSYNHKHNAANGENSRDGCNYNLSFNCGVEGETDDAAILALRRKKVKNAYAILLLSQGVPMLLAGDEFLHTQKGNNNCYCQDNELSWLNWDLLDQNGDVFRFVKLMIALRKRHGSIMRRRFLTGEKVTDKGLPDIIWHGVDLETPLWHEPDARILAYTLIGIAEKEADLHVIFNMSEQDVQMPLPTFDTHWCLALDTGLPSPEDIVPIEKQVPQANSSYWVQPFSVVVFEHHLPAVIN